MITDYSSLKTTLATWMHRSDLTAQIPDFIALAEAKFSTDLDARDMEARVVLTLTHGDAYLDLPADMLEMRRLMVLTNPTQTLKYATPDQIAADYPLDSQGKPLVFSVIGGKLQLAPVPDSDYPIELTYKQRIPALYDANPTNWLLTKWPNAYLYGALCAAQPYIMNDSRLVTFQSLYKEAVNGINEIDWYSGSTLQVRAR